MEHVDVVVRWELELVGESTDLLINLKWSEELVGELGARSVGDGGLRVRLKLEEDGVVDLKGTLNLVVVGLLLEMTLGTRKLVVKLRNVRAPIPGLVIR